MTYSINGLMQQAAIARTVVEPRTPQNGPALQPRTAPVVAPAHVDAAAQAAPTPPAGTDPALWSVLTAAERAYYAKAATMGPVTYSPATRSAPPAPPLGGRIDVRV